jgi:hypothetical protein
LRSRGNALQGIRRYCADGEIALDRAGQAVADDYLDLPITRYSPDVMAIRMRETPEGRRLLNEATQRFSL